MGQRLTDTSTSHTQKSLAASEGPGFYLEGGGRGVRSVKEADGQKARASGHRRLTD